MNYVVWALAGSGWLLDGGELQYLWGMIDAINNLSIVVRQR